MEFLAGYIFAGIIANIAVSFFIENVRLNINGQDFPELLTWALMVIFWPLVLVWLIVDKRD